MHTSTVSVGKTAFGRSPFTRLRRVAAVGGIALASLLSGCASLGGGELAGGPVPACYNQAIAQIRSADSPALHHAAAQHALHCESQRDMPGVQERMRLQAAAILALLQAGEVGQAQTQLSIFQTTFKQQDLRLPNGASFVDNVSLLVNQHSASDFVDGSLVNANPALKYELRRAHYWQSH